VADASASENAGARAAESRALLARPVTIHLDHIPLKLAIKAIANRANVRVQYTAEVLDATGINVTLNVERLPLGEVLDRVLRTTPLRIVVLDRDFIGISKTDAVPAIAAGIITGKVIDAKSRLPMRGVRISLDTVANVAQTAGDGTYRIAGVRAGTHEVICKSLGYTKVRQVVTVNDDMTATLDFALETSVTSLSQVIVTGTVVPTERKAIPNAMTIVTGKELEDRGITHIDQLFRGDIPGLFSQNVGSRGIQPGKISMSSRGSTQLDSALTQPIKTYVDGVELANSSYLALIDPRSIDRIEILTGPQASTVYGSNAINGVMQIFTKRGTTRRPQLTLNLQSGFIQNNFSNALTPQHDYSVGLSGIDSHVSYNAGGSWVYMGPWTPSVHQTTVSGFGGARFQQDPWSVDLSLRRSLGTNWQNGEVIQVVAVDGTSGVLHGNPFASARIRSDNTSNAQTLGVTLTYSPTAWWSHTLTVGSDAIDAQDRQLDPPRVFPLDSLLSFAQNQTTRTSIAYTTSAHIPVASMLDAVVTLGADGWNALTTSFTGSPNTFTGTIDNPSSFVLSRQPSHDRGMFFQGQLAAWDALFFTYGLRAEWNPTYGSQANPNVVPRYGLAYTRELGPVTAKLRGSYGHSTRPPLSTLTRGIPATPDYFPFYGEFNTQLANPDLLPEQQKGGEGGLELYIGNRMSLTVTRYNQTVTNLIESAVVDSVPLVPAYRAENGYTLWQYPAYQNRYINIGDVRNEGWELHGTMNVGPFTTTGTYSWTKSRIIGITPKYRRQFTQYVPGSAFDLIPEHTYAFGLQYGVAKTTVALNVQGQGMVYIANGGDELARAISLARLNTLSSRFSVPYPYTGRGPGYTMADLNVSRQFSSKFYGIVQVQNLGNFYQNDTGAYAAAIGRQTKAGLRVRW